MWNADVVALRREYSALVLIADGLIDMIKDHSACNVRTFELMVEEARDAAHKIASMIERLLYGASESAPVQTKKHESIFKRVLGLITDVIKRIAA